MDNSYYDSNRPYNPQKSNRPIYNVISDEQLGKIKRPSKTEGAMWGAAQTMVGATLYSGINEVARNSDPSQTMKMNPKLGAVHHAYQQTANAADKVIDGQEKFSSILRAANQSPSGRVRGFVDEFRGGSDSNNKSKSGFNHTEGMSAKDKMQYHAKNTVPDQIGKATARTLFGTGLKNNARRIGLAAIPGAITGALHNASNGIVGPY